MMARWARGAPPFSFEFVRSLESVVLFPLGVKPFTASALLTLPFCRSYCLTCVTKPTSDVTIKTHQEDNL